MRNNSNKVLVLDAVIGYIAIVNWNRTGSRKN